MRISASCLLPSGVPKRLRSTVTSSAQSRSSCYTLSEISARGKAQAHFCFGDILKATELRSGYWHFPKLLGVELCRIWVQCVLDGQRRRARRTKGTAAFLSTIPARLTTDIFTMLTTKCCSPGVTSSESSMV